MRVHVQDRDALRRAFARVPSSIVAVCAQDGSERIGMAASTFIPVSLDPPLVGICVQNSSTTWPRLVRLARMGISVLSVEHDRIVNVLAAKNGDRFCGVDAESRDDRVLFISRASLWLDVTLDEQLPAGDHSIALLRVNEVSWPQGGDEDIEPIIFHRSSFRTLVTA